MKLKLMSLVLVLFVVGCRGDDKLSGLWADVDLPVYQLELDSDGTGVERWTDTDAELEFEWEVDGDQLCITYSDNSGDCRSFSIEGDRMTLETPGGVSRMERWPEVGSGDNSADREAQSSPEPVGDPFEVFQEVRNDCGTDSPIGGWETAGGDALVLSENGTFTAILGETNVSGEWTQDGDQLCLYPEVGDDICFDYAQKIDAMELGNEIFIRR